MCTLGGERSVYESRSPVSLREYQDEEAKHRGVISLVYDRALGYSRQLLESLVVVLARASSRREVYHTIPVESGGENVQRALYDSRKALTRADRGVTSLLGDTAVQECRSPLSARAMERLPLVANADASYEMRERARAGSGGSLGREAARGNAERDIIIKKWPR